jgi:hypothetical protein
LTDVENATRRNMVTMEFPPEIVERYKETYGKHSTGLRHAAICWDYLRARLLEDLRGRFTEDELGVIVAVYRRVKLDPAIDFLHETMCLRVPTLADKVRTLSIPELMALVDWAIAYSKQVTRTLPQYVSDLL